MLRALQALGILLSTHLAHPLPPHIRHVRLLSSSPARTRCSHLFESLRPHLYLRQSTHLTRLFCSRRTPPELAQKGLRPTKPEASSASLSFFDILRCRLHPLLKMLSWLSGIDGFTGARRCPDPCPGVRTSLREAQFFGPLFSEVNPGLAFRLSNGVPPVFSIPRSAVKLLSAHAHLPPCVCCDT